MKIDCKIYSVLSDNKAITLILLLLNCVELKKNCLNYFQTSPGSNCIEDLDQILCSKIDFDEFLNLLELEKSPFKCKFGTVDYRHLNLPERNTFTYVCGYIMKKYLAMYIIYQKQLDQ